MIVSSTIKRLVRGSGAPFLCIDPFEPALFLYLVGIALFEAVAKDATRLLWLKTPSIACHVL